MTNYQIDLTINNICREKGLRYYSQLNATIQVFTEALVTNSDLDYCTVVGGDFVRYGVSLIAVVRKGKKQWVVIMNGFYKDQIMLPFRTSSELRALISMLLYRDVEPEGLGEFVKQNWVEACRLTNYRPFTERGEGYEVIS